MTMSYALAASGYCRIMHFKNNREEPHRNSTSARGLEISNIENKLLYNFRVTVAFTLFKEVLSLALTARWLTAPP